MNRNKYKQIKNIFNKLLHYLQFKYLLFLIIEILPKCIIFFFAIIIEIFNKI